VAAAVADVAAATLFFNLSATPPSETLENSLSNLCTTSMFGALLEAYNDVNLPPSNRI